MYATDGKRKLSGGSGGPEVDASPDVRRIALVPPWLSRKATGSMPDETNIHLRAAGAEIIAEHVARHIQSRGLLTGR